MLHLIKSTTDAFFKFLTEDPVRPTIPNTSRLGNNRDIFVKRDDEDLVKAITCVSYQKSIPTKEEELFETCDCPSLAIFYTIWSYESGAGKDLIFEARDWIIKNRPEITRILTLSPPTEMARKFHIKNGASVYQVNETTVNYEYK